ncbi:sialidase family protein [Rubrivirga marina]|nr:sialidase family protein [Rubrivirga marina]
MTRSLLLALAVTLGACGPPDSSASPSDAPSGVIEGAAAPVVTANAVAWVEGDGDARRLVVLPDGAEVSVEVARGQISAHGQAGPRLAPGPDGTLYVAFVEERAVEGRRFPASDLKLARSVDGGRTWAAPVAVHPDPGFPTGHTFHDLAVGPDGAVYVSWLDGTAKDRYRIEHAAEADEARGAHGHHGAPDEPGTDLAVARSTDGGRTFSAPVVVAKGTCECCRTALAVADDGVLYAAWRHVFPGTERDLALARSTDGGATWSEPTRVHEDGWAIEACPHAGGALAVAADGAVTVAWPTGADGRSGTWRATSTDGGATFGAPEPLLTNAPLGQVAAARDGRGRLWLAWEDPRSTDVFVHRPGAPDTVRVAGAAPALTGTADGWRLAWATEGGARVASGS